MIFNFFWNGYEYIKRGRIYQPIEAGGRDSPCIPIKLNVLFFSSLVKLLSEEFSHKCQCLLKFWLSFPLRPLVKWNNRLTKAEALPLHLGNIVKWIKNNPECLDANLRENHKLLYCELVTKKVLSETMSIPAITWIRSQPKELDNRLKDFNWLVLHRRLPVRETLYDQKLTNSKTCPRHKCNIVETIAYVLWECSFAQSIWQKLKSEFPCLNEIDYRDMVYFELKKS